MSRSFLPDRRPEQGRRGVALTVLLVLLALGQVLVILLAVLTLDDDLSHGRDESVLPAAGALVIGLAALAGLAGIGAWRRWGVWLFVAAAVIGTVVDVVAGLSLVVVGIRILLVLATLFQLDRRWPADR